MATFILQILLSLFVQHGISCSGNCGPANEMECNGFETCLSATLQCITNEDCQVECEGGSSSCGSATIQANGVNQLAVGCGDSGENQSDQCKAIKINAQNIDGEIHITCTGGQHTCSYMEVNATGSDSLTIDCDTFESCQNMTINCAEDCSVNCTNAQNNVCIGTSVICGRGDCEIDCSGGGQKCHSMGVIDASQASSFTCIGTSAECTGVSNQLITAEYHTPAHAHTSYPTQSPINPTITPELTTTSTFVPTAWIEDEPTFSPTNATITKDADQTMLLTTNFHTISPTHSAKGPTNNPSETPTNLPTNNPSGTPTNRPTNVPTNSPTNLPTNMPTIDLISTLMNSDIQSEEKNFYESINILIAVSICIGCCIILPLIVIIVYCVINSRKKKRIESQVSVIVHINHNKTDLEITQPDIEGKEHSGVNNIFPKKIGDKALKLAAKDSMLSDDMYVTTTEMTVTAYVAGANVLVTQGGNE